MAERDRIELRVTGTELNESVRVKDFANKITQFVDLLLEYDKAVSGGAIEYYKIGGLSYNSPPMVMPEAVAKIGRGHEVQTIHENLLREIQGLPSGEVSDAMNVAVLSKLQTLCKPAKGRIKGMEIVHRGTAVRVGPDTLGQIESVLGGTTYAYGEVVGSLDNIMLHDEANPYFVIFPSIGARSVNCYFSDPRIEEEATAYRRKLVAVRGVLSYRERGNHPIRIDVSEVELLENEPVSLLEMFQRAPIPGAGQLVREERNGWDEA